MYFELVDLEDVYVLYCGCCLKLKESFLYGYFVEMYWSVNFDFIGVLLGYIV